MNTIVPLAAGVFLNLLISIAVLASLSMPLRNVLVDLCPTTKQAEFWLNYTRIMLLLAPLLVVLIVDNLFASHNLLQSLKIASIASLSGLILGLVIVGTKVFESIAFSDNLEGQA
jgi:hypothetical protein